MFMYYFCSSSAFIYFKSHPILSFERNSQKYWCTISYKRQKNGRMRMNLLSLIHVVSRRTFQSIKLYWECKAVIYIYLATIDVLTPRHWIPALSTNSGPLVRSTAKKQWCYLYFREQNENEPPHDKTNKTNKTYSNWAATRQNRQSDCAPSEDSGQPGHPPSLISLRRPHEKSLDP